MIKQFYLSQRQVLTDTTIGDQCGSWNNVNEQVLHFTQN